MKGQVTISLEDFKAIEATHERGLKLQKEAVDLKYEVDRLLTFLNTKVNMEELALHYNQIRDNTSELIVDGETCQLRRKKKDLE